MREYNTIFVFETGRRGIKFVLTAMRIYCVLLKSYVLTCGMTRPGQYMKTVMLKIFTGTNVAISVTFCRHNPS